jgi:hypothetical protein
VEGAVDNYYENAAKRPELVFGTLRELRKPEYAIDILKLACCPKRDRAGRLAANCQKLPGYG